MANSIEPISDIRPVDGFVTSTSRYADGELVYYEQNDLRKITFKTYKRKEIENSSQDRFMVIPSNMEYRPDLVSRKAYGTVDFWWTIMEANNIFDIFDFKAGRNIRIPNNVFL